MKYFIITFLLNILFFNSINSQSIRVESKLNEIQKNYSNISSSFEIAYNYYDVVKGSINTNEFDKEYLNLYGKLNDLGLELLNTQMIATDIQRILIAENCANAIYGSERIYDNLDLAHDLSEEIMSDLLSSMTSKNKISFLTNYHGTFNNQMSLVIENISLSMIGVPIISTEHANCTPIYKRKNETSCIELYGLVQVKGTQLESLSNRVMNSDWLNEVKVYRYQNKLFVSANIKDVTTKTYLFCNIPDSNWDRFKNGGLYDSNSYGERFHKYVFEYKCDCN